MKIKSKPTTPFVNVPISVWKVSGKPVTIDEFIEEGIGCVDATSFHYALRSLNGRLLEKLESINSDEYPGLREAVQVIADDARLLEPILERNQLELMRYLGKPRGCSF